MKFNIVIGDLWESPFSAPSIYHNYQGHFLVLANYILKQRNSNTELPP